jgi:hypothetical protein
MAVRKRGKGWMLDVYFDGNRQRQMIPNARLENSPKKLKSNFRTSYLKTNSMPAKKYRFLPTSLMNIFCHGRGPTSEVGTTMAGERLR